MLICLKHLTSFDTAGAQQIPLQQQYAQPQGQQLVGTASQMQQWTSAQQYAQPQVLFTTSTATIDR